MLCIAPLDTYTHPACHVWAPTPAPSDKTCNERVSVAGLGIKSDANGVPNQPRVRARRGSPTPPPIDRRSPCVLETFSQTGGGGSGDPRTAVWVATLMACQVLQLGEYLIQHRR